MLIVWEFVLNPTVGVWKAVADLSGVSPINLLRNEATALPILAMISIWQNLGFAVVLFLAGLSGIPGEMYEAAELDGADDAFSRFRRITWPMVGHVTFFVVVMLTVRSFQVFESVAVLTQAAPMMPPRFSPIPCIRKGLTFSEPISLRPSPWCSCW